MNSRNRLQPFIKFGLLCALCAVPMLAVAVTIYNEPLTKPRTVPGNLVLVPSVEWPTVVTHANDPGQGDGGRTYSDSPAQYVGYFNPDLCYAYHHDGDEKNRYFYPVSRATGNNFSCAGQRGGNAADGNGADQRQNLWSGNFLNWATMQAVDTFRMALTGGYRVHVPETGTLQSVNVIGSDGAVHSYTTSELASITFLEKGNSDRWDNSYTKLRRVTANAGNATPFTGAVSTSNFFLTRIAGLRNQMWFIPYSNGSNNPLGDSEAYNNPQPIQLPLSDGEQTTMDGDGPAIPYDPTIHLLPNTNTTYNCQYGGANGSGDATTGDTDGTCQSNDKKVACKSSSYKYFRTATGRCHANNNDTSQSEPHHCPTGWKVPTNSGNASTTTQRACTLTSYQGTPVYGRNTIYAVSIRVQVCDGTWDLRDFCTHYPSGHYKPEGLLQRNAAKIRYGLFSYLTETGQVRNGGVMRVRQKLIGPVGTNADGSVITEKPYPDERVPGHSRIPNIDNPEWDPQTGVFLDNPDTADATATSNNVGNCGDEAPDGSQCVIRYSGVINYLNRFGQILTGQQTLKSYDNLSEMYYTALRYLRGLANVSSFSSLAKLSNSDLAGSGAIAKYRNADGLPVIENWYNTGANSPVTAWSNTDTSAPSNYDPMLYKCQTNVVLGIGDTHTNNEDETSGLTWDATANPNGSWRGYTEFSSGGNGRGNLAGLGYWAHLNDIRSDIPNIDIANRTAGSKRGQTISTYWVDVVEQNDLYAANTNQFYNLTKYGGYKIPDDDWGPNGNATRHDRNWFESNRALWTSATQNVKAATGLGGTGDYRLPDNMYLANNGQKMIEGLTAAFKKIAENLAGSGASLSANSTQLTEQTKTYQAVYFTNEWRGDLKAFSVRLDGTIATTADWQAAEAFPSPANRNILTCTSASGICTAQAQLDTSIPASLKSALGTSAAEQNNMISYLRGNNVSGLRVRSTPLGDIVNSQPVYVGIPNANLYKNNASISASFSAYANDADVKARPHVIYVAANDGMLHGFNAENGRELFAYLPQAVIKCTGCGVGDGAGGIKNIAAPNYGTDANNPHQFWNDGELTVADVECPEASCPGARNGWATVLVGTTGRGPSKAVYALDVTDPSSPYLLWERSAVDGAEGSNYIGRITGKPIIARMGTGNWVALIGNGYGSAENAPALLQFSINSGALAVYTTTGGALGAGLAAPAVWISDPANSLATHAYAGDLDGNVWAFSLATAATPGTKIFIAEDDAGINQPITAGLAIAKNTKDDKVWVFFGTGQFLSRFERDDGLNTWYGLIVQGDGSVHCTAGSCTARGQLTRRKIVAEIPATNNSLAARGISGPPDADNDNIPDDDMSGRSGWYMDLRYGGHVTGERIVTPNQFRGAYLIGTTRLPNSGSDPCNPSGSGWIMAVDPFTGAPPPANRPFFDVNDNGTFTDDTITYTDESGTHTVSAAGVGFSAVPNNPIFTGSVMLISFDDAQTGSVNTNSDAGGIPRGRLSWRELVGQ